MSADEKARPLLTRRSLDGLGGIIHELVCDDIERLGLRRLTVDLDGSVIRTGNQVAWAVRGYNPHHPKDPSYYPIFAHLAETGQILRLKNRPGNVVDSTGAHDFLRDLIAALRGRFGRSMPLDFRTDAAFFKEDILKLLPRLGCDFAIKVPFWKWLGLKNLVVQQERWIAIAPGIEAFETRLPIKQWKLDLRVAVYRKRVQHDTPKNFQLDLFSPDNGTFEYSAVTTNKSLGLKALWYFCKHPVRCTRFRPRTGGCCSCGRSPSPDYTSRRCTRSHHHNWEVALLRMPRRSRHRRWCTHPRRYTSFHSASAGRCKLRSQNCTSPLHGTGPRPCRSPDSNPCMLPTGKSRSGCRRCHRRRPSHRLLECGCTRSAHRKNRWCRDLNHRKSQLEDRGRKHIVSPSAGVIQR